MKVDASCSKNILFYKVFQWISFDEANQSPRHNLLVKYDSEIHNTKLDFSFIGAADYYNRYIQQEKYTNSPMLMPRSDLLTKISHSHYIEWKRYWANKEEYCKESQLSLNDKGIECIPFENLLDNARKKHLVFGLCSLILLFIHTYFVEYSLQKIFI